MSAIRGMAVHSSSLLIPLQTRCMAFCLSMRIPPPAFGTRFQARRKDFQRRCLPEPPFACRRLMRTNVCIAGCYCVCWRKTTNRANGRNRCSVTGAMPSNGRAAGPLLTGPSSAGCPLGLVRCEARSGVRIRASCGPDYACCGHVAFCPIANSRVADADRVEFGVRPPCISEVRAPRSNSSPVTETNSGAPGASPSGGRRMTRPPGRWTTAPAARRPWW